GQTLRLNMLKTHYRSPIDWTLKSLQESDKTLEEWHAVLLQNPEALTTQWDSSKREIHPPLIDALCDDLNTSKAISELHGLRNSVVHSAVPNVTAFGDGLDILGLLGDE